MAAEREAVAAVSRAVVDAPKASLSALCRSKAVTIEEQKVLAAVRASRAPLSVLKGPAFLVKCGVRCSAGECFATYQLPSM